MKKIFLLFIVHCTFLIVHCYATHNRAGEITYRQISNLTYEITITTYTYEPSLADRCQLEIKWGDGLSDILPRNNGPNGYNRNNDYCDHLGIIVGVDMKWNTYSGTHTYPAAGTYIISLEDPTRNGGVVNIPNSVDVPFYIESKLVINPFIGHVNSPVLLNPPIDNACVGRPFIHNPGAYDADGDSLSYSLQPCKGGGGKFIPGYAYPQTSNIFQINPITGDLLWDSPVLQGEYNVAILIKAWRNGVVVCSIIRDMQILVATCDIHPPNIIAFNDTCIIEGTKLDSLVTAKSGSGNKITLSASGGLFMINDNPATFITSYGVSSVSSRFKWQTNCSHVKKFPWSVIFRAVVAGTPVNLVALKTVQITVVAPPLKNLTATPLGNSIELKWNKSPCANASGYKIYRNTKCLHLEVNNCQTGVPPGFGYILIGQTKSVNDTTYVDDNNGKGLIPGINYGYVVTSYFNDGAESLVSNESCSYLIKNIPVITNISILKTDNSKGNAYIAWSKPNQIDTNKIHSPFSYSIYHSAGIQNSAFTLQHTNIGINDTIYTDTLLNTVANPYNYRIDLYGTVNGNSVLMGSTKVATSVFLSIKPTDHELDLSWYVNVPWRNDKYVIYRQKPGNSQYDSIGWTNGLTYSDKDLVNGAEYCYYIKSIGTYSAPGFIDPIINYSQQACAKPIDNIPPCTPDFSVDLNCRYRQDILTWENPNQKCTDGTNDVVRCLLYYYPSTEKKDSFLIRTIPVLANTAIYSVIIDTLVGCYSLFAQDSTKPDGSPGNISIKANKICLDVDENNSCIKFIYYEGNAINEGNCTYVDRNSDTCYFYKLPNVFTPNGSGKNDYFIPFHVNYLKKYIDNIDIKIFNRWGTLVFQTNDPAIEWNGKDMHSNKDCSEGVYFYVCTVYENSLKGPVSRVLSGTVTILR